MLLLLALANPQGILAISGMLCSVTDSGGMLPTVSDLCRSEGVPLILLCRSRHRRSSGTPQLLDCCWIYVSVRLCLYKCGLRMCTDLATPSYLAVSCLLVEGALGAGKEPTGLGSGRTAAAIGSAGPAGDLKNALLRSRLGC